MNYVLTAATIDVKLHVATTLVECDNGKFGYDLGHCRKTSGFLSPGGCKQLTVYLSNQTAQSRNEDVM